MYGPQPCDRRLAHLSAVLEAGVTIPLVQTRKLEVTELQCKVIGEATECKTVGAGVACG